VESTARKAATSVRQNAMLCCLAETTVPVTSSSYCYRNAAVHEEREK
jgi:hypothetical protein